MIAETQALEKLALKLESDQHRYGWDEPPVFARVYGEQTRPGLYGFGISEVPVPDQVLQERPFPETLREMSLLMRYGRKYATDDAPDELFDMLAEVHRQSAADNFVGYTLICEAWMNNELGEEEARKGTHRPLADIVGSKEVRTVYIADVGGRLIYAQRIRGEKPTVVVTGAGAGDDTFKASGRLAKALRDYTWCTARHCRPDLVDLEAIDRMVMEDGEDEHDCDVHG